MKNRYLAKVGTAALATLILATGMGAPAQATTTPSPNAINTYSRAAVATAYANQWLPTTSSPINWTGNAANCVPGTESADSLAKGAQAVNFYRGLAGLDSISLTASQNTLAQQTALLMEANQQLNHYPPSTWKCYTAQGAQGAGSSNLFGGTGGFTINSAGTPIKAYMDDTGDNNWPVGHRRWILNPSTVTMGMGTTLSFNALNVNGAPTDTTRTSPTMIGFPGSGYFPQQLEPNGRWSLSSDQGVDFTNATVSVTNANGAALTVNPLSTNDGYGPNTISFQVAGLSYASGTGEADYKVTVNNMKAHNLPFSYTYTVRLFDGTVSTSNVAPADAMPTLPQPTPVTPVAPTFGYNTYTIPPEQTGIDYKVNGVVTQPGTYDATGTILIQAEATSPYYTVSGNGAWMSTFTPPPAPTPTTTATPTPTPTPNPTTPVVTPTPTPTTTPTPIPTPTPTTPVTTPTPAPLSAIAVKAQSLNGSLGAALGGEVYGIKDGGGYQCFQLGCIVWSPATGAHVSTGGIRAQWQATGFEGGGLGYPTTDEVTGLKNGGVYQNYQGGAIVWSPSTGAHVSTGAIRGEWQATGFENGGLGYPIGNEVSGLRNGGVYQMYQGGAIVWSPATGAHISIGGIRAQWQATGFENGGLGYPTSDEVSGLKNGGVYQNYQGGAIVWSPTTGAHISAGGIRGEWQATGFENGYLGYPITDEVPGLINGGVYQMYQGGAIVWSPASGAHASTGAIRSMWASQGFETGRLGYPTSDEYVTSPGNVAQNYQGGIIRWGSNGSGITYN